MLKFLIIALIVLAALAFALALILVVMWLAGSLSDTLYFEVRTLSGGYRSPSFAEVFVFLIVVGGLAAAAALFLTRYR